MSEEMVIFVRTLDLVKWVLPHTENFPRFYRRSITQRLQDALLDFQEALHDANAHSGGGRIAALQAADAQLNKLRLYLRLAYDWEWLSIGQYEHVSQMVAEIGRLLGGWIKQTKSV
jgi:hypothetical protein